MIGGELEGDPAIRVSGVASVYDAGVGDVVLADNEKYFARALETSAACIIAGRGTPGARGKCVIRVDDPTVAFVSILEFFRSDEPLPAVGVAPGAFVGGDVQMGRDVAIGPNCYVGDSASLGDGCVLFPGVYVGAGVSIGEGGKLYPNVVIHHGCTLGRNVTLHAGVVIGADGFGYASGPVGLVKFPHTGSVEVGDDVEIGANSTVDRAKTGATIIGSGTKIDNLVHIAHNVKIGRNCIIVALSGVAGSVVIGDNVTLAAQTGVKDHVHIADGCVVAARAGVIGDLGKGQVVSGFPARDHKLDMRVEASRLHLPEILRRLKNVESELEKLFGRQTGNGDSERQK